MAINSIGQDSSVYGDYNKASVTKNKSKLDKNDFMTLLMAQLQNQDPTKPTDTATILTQTSQLASLESSDNTNQALKDLSTSLATSNNFGSISAIGKIANLGSDTVTYAKGKDTNFDIYFPSDIASGNVNILDSNGKTVKTISAESGNSGVYSYSWDGKDTAGHTVKEGIYHVKASYKNGAGEDLTTKVGQYPIEAIKFDNGTTYAKVGSGYVAIKDIAEIY